MVSARKFDSFSKSTGIDLYYSKSFIHRVSKMMRKIEQGMIEAIKARKNYSNDNTQVYSDSGTGYIHVHLHSHKIAILDTVDNTLTLPDCGYQTKTAKSRLNCLLSHFNLPTISAKNFQWYIGTEVWNGSTSYLIPQKESEEEREAKAIADYNNQPAENSWQNEWREDPEELVNKCLEVLGF